MSSGSPVSDEMPPFRISFVCTGNICRSPMAEVVLREQVRRAGLEARVSVESAGTGDWHVGEQADRRTIEALAGRGYDGSLHRARQFESASFPSLDLIVVFDRSQDRILRNWAHNETDAAKVRMLLGFDPELAALGDVPDPYYSGPEMFESVLVTIERATASLFRQLAPALRSPTT
ncbi:low molecular weight phosphotyrosine protein phosphatase [Glaciibacter flavus]|uniref:protein-tyrosine-phosphatase n=1 Tax=Orlajensenia flava TaxID=2565934 RepID=A0A4S4FUW1_9MICO|nr:low molecular weight protein-tyrosine-phosphatase [Glaciibacter flavus]THG34078.1 low molecular weight phosphotyrosine protein phosphatase [Glaciibacter flavus]